MDDEFPELGDDFGDWSDWAPLLAGPLAPGVFVAQQLVGAGDVLPEGRKPDIDAINTFIQETIPLNTKASEIKQEWDGWYPSLGWFEFVVEGQANFDKARNLRNAFVLANDPSLKDVVATGITAEEQEGAKRRADDSGNLPSPPLLPQWMKVSAGVAVIGGIALGIASVISKLNPVNLLLRR